MNDYELLCCIVAHEKGSKVLRIAKNYGIKSGTIFLGKGTVKNHLLEILDLTDSRKEVVIMVADTKTALYAAQKLSEELAFHKHGHGIAFTMPIKNLLCTRNYEKHNIFEKTEDEHMYDSIFTIVDKGLSAEVISAAQSAGAPGGTIIHARGSGIHETEMLFAMPVEPEREIVLILAKTETVDSITEAISKRLKMDEPGNGIMFICNVKKTYGLY